MSASHELLRGQPDDLELVSAATTSSAWTPIEPVEPSTSRRLVSAIAATLHQARAARPKASLAERRAATASTPASIVSRRAPSASSLASSVFSSTALHAFARQLDEPRRLSSP